MKSAVRKPGITRQGITETSRSGYSNRISKGTDFTDNRVSSQEQSELLSSINNSPRSVAQRVGIKKAFGGAVQRKQNGIIRDSGTVQFSGGVIQMVIKQDVMGKGFTDEEAEELKTLMGSWTFVKNYVLSSDKPLTPALFESIKEKLPGNASQQRAWITQLGNLTPSYLDKLWAKFSGNNSLMRMIAARLDETHFEIIMPFFNKTIVSLFKKGLTNDLIDEALSTDGLSLQTMSDMGHMDSITDISKLDKVFADYPSFRQLVKNHTSLFSETDEAIIGRVINKVNNLNTTALKFLETHAGKDITKADHYSGINNLKKVPGILVEYPSFLTTINDKMVSDLTDLQVAISWLAGAHADSRTYLEKATPPLNSLKKMAEGSLSVDNVEQMAWLREKAHPGNNAIKTVSGSVAKYRTGHFLMGHAIQYIDDGGSLTGGKTLWPYKTTEDNVEEICKEYDDTYSVALTGKIKATRTMTPAKGGNATGVQIRAGNNWDSGGTVDQMYPTTGKSLDPTEFDAIKAARDEHNSWPDY